MAEKSKFLIPTKEIRQVRDIDKWLNSVAYSEYLGFIIAMNDAVKGKKLSDECTLSEVTENLLKLLDTMSVWVDEIPPMDQPQRFGNKAFRTYYDRIKENADKLIRDVLLEEHSDAIIELRPYLVESIGNPTRIDYGTGHEMSFAMFLCCLFQIKALTPADSPAIILKVFSKYMDLTRKLQVTYRMEPAGSHGVWSLDDYQFLPFIWGSAQLINHPKLTPKCFTDADVAETYADDQMFMACVKFINQVKNGPFSEHSNQLWNISGVPSWTKVNTGLIKMYKAEVLGKFPVIQHTLFGSLLPITWHAGK